MFTVITKHEPSSKEGIYAISQPVRWFSPQIKVAERMKEWLNKENGHFPAPFVTAYAIAHCQVARFPYAFFVVSEQLLLKTCFGMRPIDKNRNRKNFYFPDQCIFNARILEAPEKVSARVPKREVIKEDGKIGSKITVTDGLVSNKIYVPDACMSFPDKKTTKNVERYYRVKVRYQIKTWYGFKTITEWVEGLKAHIFQHECDHFVAKNIYYGKTK